MINKIAKLLSKNQKLYKYIKYIYSDIFYYHIIYPVKNYNARERKVSWGEENPDKTFYVIRRFDTKCGLFSWIDVIIGHLIKSHINGWIPVVDMKTYATPFLEEQEKGKINAWEVFFKQPEGYNLEDIKNSKNIILSYAFVVEETPYLEIFSDINKREKASQICKKYIRYQDNVQEEIDIMKEKMFGNNKVLGLLCRGTDYINLKPKGHPRQPTIEQIIQKTHEALEQMNYDKIYICTEDISFLNAICTEFKEKVVSVPREYIEYKNGYLVDNKTNLINSKQKLAYDYLMQIALLADTDAIVAGRCSGSMGALFFRKRGGYEYEYFWDLGLYS